MTEEGNIVRFRRLTVALDAAACATADLQTAVDLAVLIGAELHGLFIEDVDLLQVAGLPFVREVGRHSARDRPLERQSVEIALRSQVARAVTRLERAGQARKLTVTSTTARGKILRQALERREQGEVLLLGDAGQRRCGARTRTALLTGRPVMTWFDKLTRSRDALSLAVDLADHFRSGLVVAFLQDEFPSEAELRAGLGAVVGALPSPVWLQGFAHLDAASLVALARRVCASQLVLAEEGLLAGPELLEQLWGSIDSGLIVVR